MNSLDLAFSCNIANLVSKSGLPISTIIPHSNLLLSLGSRFSNSFGALSQDITICLLDSYNILKILYNSFCVCSFFARNCTSSIISTSTSLYLSLSLSILLFLTAVTYSVINLSAVIYAIFLSLNFLIISFQAACNK